MFFYSLFPFWPSEKLTKNWKRDFHLDGGVGGVVHHSWGESIEAEGVKVINFIVKEKEGVGWAEYLTLQSLW